MIDESEVLTPADPYFHINKKDYEIPFVCGATELGEAVRRIWEGASMIRTKGEAGTGNVVAAVTHARIIDQEIQQIKKLDDSGIADPPTLSWKDTEYYLTSLNYPVSTI